MKFLLDQGLPRSTTESLRLDGLVATHVGDLGLAAATDEEILVKGRSLNAVVVTLDSDFHTLFALSNASSPSVIRIRAQGLKGPGVAMIISKVHKVARQDLESGAVVPVSDHRLAVRRLPINRRERKG